ncbi:MAG TPA: protoporphyrinogen oxidase [Acidimicrobiales bacterium]
MNVAVIGGGIAGLAAAWQLATGPLAAEITVFEPGRLGGSISTTPFAGFPVDEGADAFIARVPDGLRLCGELGIDAELVAPEAGRALLWVGGRLRALPEGLMLGVPGRILPVLRSRLLSPTGLLRAGLDVVLPRTDWPEDLSLADLISRRLGRQVAVRLVDPLLGGIHAGDTALLSAEAVAPQLNTAARRGRSLLLTLRGASPPPGPTFLAPRGGMGRLVTRLVEALTEKGVCFEPNAVSALGGEKGGRVDLGAAGVFDRVVLAVPAAVASRLLHGRSPDAARELAAIPTASVALVTLSYPRDGVDVAAGASGILVPRGEGRLMTACSFGSRKWPHWSSPDHAVLRVSTGRYRDERALQLTDEDLVERLLGEVASALRTAAVPTEWRVSRWPAAFPQYLVGHLQRVERLERILARDVPQVALAGASYRGSGIPACIASGRRAADLVTAATA